MNKPIQVCLPHSPWLLRAATSCTKVLPTLGKFWACASRTLSWIRLWNVQPARMNVRCVSRSPTSAASANLPSTSMESTPVWPVLRTVCLVQLVPSVRHVKKDSSLKMHSAHSAPLGASNAQLKTVAKPVTRTSMRKMESAKKIAMELLFGSLSCSLSSV